MPWPAGGAEPLRPRRGDPLADRGRHRRPADRRATGSRPATAPTRSCAEIWRVLAPGGRVDLHRPEPLRPLGAPRRHPLRLRPPLQLRPARGAAAHATASRPSATPPRSTRRRRTASSGCRPPTSGSASAAASSPRVIAGALLVEATKQVYARPPSVRLEGRRARPARRPRRPTPAQARAGRAATAAARSPSPPATAERRRAAAAAHLRAASTYCHAPDPLLSPRRFRWGRGAPFRARWHSVRPRGAGVRTTEGCRWPAQLH